ncbi:hypothetical protein HYPSUDRAFT_36214 [Hypholoma sublateritium FD-334 SS-4]|uniref:MICOS complex subunit n=1 Tax=Hypholoma sublateritium (strain FD-334 SS-4) TaxID=945553 RepID=A0A0D2P6D4_HYPSF|nr:hypothetical protein HYPSUDRAFT_36214 [Hypholoma sublateritium FD-334 SS-4]
MFRTASRVPRRAFLSVAAGTAVGLHESPEKLSIYPSPTPDILLVDTPSQLEREIGVVRRHVLRAYGDAHAHVQGWVSRWIGVEHAVEKRVKAIIAPDEALTPGLLYTGVAGLTGSILARNRMLPTRALLPPLLLVLSARHFLPQTSGNLAAYLGDLEDTYFPTFAEKHEIAKAHSAMTWDRVKETTKGGREWIDHGAVVAVEKIQETTGLKLKETLGWNKAGTVEAAEKAASETGSAVTSKVEEVQKKVEQKAEVKAEEVKRLV